MDVSTSRPTDNVLLRASVSNAPASEAPAANNPSAMRGCANSWKSLSVIVVTIDSDAVDFAQGLSVGHSLKDYHLPKVHPQRFGISGEY